MSSYLLKGLILFSFITLLDSKIFAQQKELLQDEYNLKMYIIDTIEYKVPVVITVADTIGKLQYFLIDSLVNKGIQCDNIFYPTYKFKCLLNNYNSISTSEEDKNYHMLKSNLSNSGMESWSRINDCVLPKNYSAYSININTFLVILVRNDFLNLCQSRDEILITGNHNSYSKIFVPIINGH